MKTHSIAHANIACARSLLAQLVESGVRDVVVSSGARCAPLVLAVSERNALRVWTQPDERSAAFVALGATMTTGRPTVLICTSGTAGANYFPAVIEASLSHVPLVVLTADRPASLHGCGAPQTIDQDHLFGGYVKLSVTLPLPEADQPGIATRWADEAERILQAAVDWPAGPVHCNVPFDEPLLPDPSEINAFTPRVIPERAAGASASPPPEPAQLDTLCAIIDAAERGLLIAGPLKDSNVNAIAQLSAATGFPLVADVASQLRSATDTGATVISTADLLVHNEAFATATTPDLIIRFGGLPTSKRLNQWLSRQRPRAHVIIADSQPIADPYAHATLTIRGNPHAAAAYLSKSLPVSGAGRGAYASLWSAADRRVRSALDDVFTSQPDLFEGTVVADVFEIAPPGTMVMLGNSMPIRLAESYVAAGTNALRVLFNRGANGIDGVVSTAVGAAVSSESPVVLIIGDVSALHDLGGLRMLSQYTCDLTVVILNNDGGGIFSFLPLAEHDAMFDSLIAMPHGRSFADLARFLDVEYSAPETRAEFKTALADSLQRRGPKLIEVRTDRRQTKAVSDAIAQRIAEMDLIEP